jgi:hypothetical protein
MMRKRDALEAAGFNLLLVFTGMVTLPLSSAIADGVPITWVLLRQEVFVEWRHNLAKTIILFAFRTAIHYAWRRIFRRREP